MISFANVCVQRAARLRDDPLQRIVRLCYRRQPPTQPTNPQLSTERIPQPPLRNSSSVRFSGHATTIFDTPGPGHPLIIHHRATVLARAKHRDQPSHFFNQSLKPNVCVQRAARLRDDPLQRIVRPNHGRSQRRDSATTRRRQERPCSCDTSFLTRSFWPRPSIPLQAMTNLVPLRPSFQIYFS